VSLKQLEEYNSSLLELPKELSILKDITALHLDNFKNEVTSFCNRVKSLHSQIELIDDDNQLNNVKDFIQVGKFSHLYYHCDFKIF
jgi:UDP-N-acetylmuramate-alanine ligase